MLREALVKKNGKKGDIVPFRIYDKARVLPTYFRPAKICTFHIFNLNSVRKDNFQVI